MLSGQCLLNAIAAVGSFNSFLYQSQYTAQAGTVYTSPVSLLTALSVAGLGVQLPVLTGALATATSVVQLGLYTAEKNDTYHHYLLLGSTGLFSVSGAGGAIVAPFSNTSQPVLLAAGATAYVALFVQSTSSGVVLYANNNSQAAGGPMTTHVSSMPAVFAPHGTDSNSPFRAELLPCA